uniref:Uncharacterized protein n=1 Tax=Mycena chlorophos TaxID=658473 RepID=A0ABQ0L0Y4_MYCCL|nr:predicted protein [Mycena chlorophos]
MPDVEFPRLRLCRTPRSPFFSSLQVVFLPTTHANYIITKHSSWSSSVSTLVSPDPAADSDAVSLFPARVTRERPSAWLDVAEVSEYFSEEERAFPFRRRLRRRRLQLQARARTTPPPAVVHSGIQPENAPTPTPTPTPTAALASPRTGFQRCLHGLKGFVSRCRRRPSSSSS